MTSLFIANCTRQIRIVFFRIDFNQEGQRNQFRSPSQREVKPGQQEQLRDMHIDAANAVCEQLRIYGMRAVSEIGRLNDGEFVPMVFNVDQPVKASLIRDVMDHNHHVKFLDGDKRRKAAAVASTQTVQDAVEQNLLSQNLPAERLPNMREGSVEFEQLDTTAEDQVRLEQGVRVNANAQNQPPQPPAKTRNKPGPKPRNKAA